MSEDPLADDRAEEARRGRVVRLVVLGIVAAIAITSIVIVLVRRPHAIAPVAKRDGGAAVHAPAGPKLPGQPGTRLAGVVVDGAGIPVAGAQVSAEVEQ